MYSTDKVITKSLLCNYFYFLFKGQATDIQIQANEIQRLKEKINEIYVKHTGVPLDKIGKKNNRY